MLNCALRACVVALCLGVAACGGDGGTQPPGEAPRAATVRTSGNAFTPAPVRIKMGGTVTWELPAAHDVNFEDAGIPDLAFGVGESRTFATAGTYRFRCDAHSTNFTSGMVGSVTVVP